MAERPDLIMQLTAYGDVLRAAERARVARPSPSAVELAVPSAAGSLRPGRRPSDRGTVLVLAAAVVVVLMILAGAAIRRSSEGSLGSGGGSGRPVPQVPAGPRFAPATVPPDLVPMAAADGWSAPGALGEYPAPASSGRPPAATVQAFRITRPGEEGVTLHVTVEPGFAAAGRATPKPAVRGVGGLVAEWPAPGGRPWSRLEWSDTSARIRAEAILPIARVRALVAALGDRPGGSLAGFDPPGLPVDGAGVTLAAEHVAAPGEPAPPVSRVWYRSTRDAAVPGPSPTRRLVITSVEPVAGVAAALLDSETGTVPTTFAGRLRLRWVGFDHQQVVTSLEADGTETVVEASGLTDDEMEQVVAGLGPAGTDGWAALRAAATVDLRRATIFADHPLDLGRVTSYVGGDVGATIRGACLEIAGRSVCNTTPSIIRGPVAVTTGAGPLEAYDELRHGYVASVVLNDRWYVFGWRPSAGPVRTSPAAETAQDVFGDDRFYVIAPEGDRVELSFESDRFLEGALGTQSAHPAYVLGRPDP
jgi:hypothetical protein